MSGMALTKINTFNQCLVFLLPKADRITNATELTSYMYQKHRNV